MSVPEVAEKGTSGKMELVCSRRLKITPNLQRSEFFLFFYVTLGLSTRTRVG